MFDRKSRSNNWESAASLISPSISTSSTVCILQLLVAVTSCFVLAVSIQRYYNTTGTLGVSDWLQLLDGVTGLGTKTDCLKSSNFRWPGRQFLSVISAVTKWCSAHYISCLSTALISQIFVMFISERKWFSNTSFICLFWVGLILLSGWKSKQWVMYNMLLSVLTCGMSIYLLLVLMFGDKMFGQKRKKKRKSKESKFEVEDTKELQQTHREEQQSNTKKLKLPEELDELEFAEEKLSLDENICMSSLSLGPGDLNNGRKYNNNGSWFRKELNDSFEASNESLELSSGSNSLIWPAKFHVNGVSVCARNTTNDPLSENKTPVGSFGEFSDDDGSLFQTENFKGGRNNLHPNKRRKRERMRTICTCSNLQRVVLVCSLTLNIIFLWMWKNS